VPLDPASWSVWQLAHAGPPVGEAVEKSTCPFAGSPSLAVATPP